VLIVDDIDLIIPAIEDDSVDILKKNKAKQDTMYDRIEVELKGV
jgi:hypothetical protein